MKKILASLLCAACLAFAGNASAAVQEFGPDFARFTIDVKDWTPTATPNGASFLSADKTCNVVVAVDKNGGANAETLCKAIADQSGMKDAKERQEVFQDLNNTVPDLNFSNGRKQKMTWFLYKHSPKLYFALRLFIKSWTPKPNFE